MPHKEEHKICWYMPGQIGQVCSIGKEVFAVHDNLNIYFHNTVDHSELIYNATSEELGFGIECFEDDAVQEYLAVGLTDLEQVVALSSYPNYQISVWCWRTNKKLVACETTVRSTNFVLSWSLTQSLIFHGWNKEYYVWEIIPCYKICTYICRKLVGNIPSIVDVTWTSEGNLFCVDDFANIYQLIIEGIGVIAIKEWFSPISIRVNPRIISFKDGFLFYGPDETLQYITKTAGEWKEKWEYEPDSSLINVIDGGFGQILCITESGTLLKINCEDKGVNVTTVMFWQQNIRFVEILKPSGNFIISLNDQNLICLWNRIGTLEAKMKLHYDVIAMSCSPTSPLIAMCVKSHYCKYGVWIASIEGNKIKSVCHDLLTDHPLMHILWSPDSNNLVSCCFHTGQIFFLALTLSGIEVLHLFDIGNMIYDCLLFLPSNYLHFMALASSVGNGKDLLCYKFHGCDSVPVIGKIDSEVAKVLYLDNHLIVMDSLSKSVQLFTVKMEGNSLIIAFKTNVKLEHEIASISMKCEYGSIITWGLDGLILFYSSIVDSQIKFKIKAKHYLSETIKYVLFDPQKRFVVSVTHKGTLSIHNLTKAKTTTDVIERSQIPTTKEIEDVFANEYFTWIERRDQRLAEEETKKWAGKRQALKHDFTLLQKKLVKLMEQNILAPPLHQLPLNAFNLHIEGQQHKAKEAALEREAVREDLEEVIKCQDKVCIWVKTNCWDAMNVVEKKIFAIFRSNFVENCPLVFENKAVKEVNLFVKKYRQFESAKDINLFMPWIAPKVESVSQKKLKESIISEQEEKGEADEGSMEERESFVKFIHQLSGTSSHLYVTPNSEAYPQLLTQTNFQMRLQHHFIQDNIKNLKLWFNKQFDNMMETKRKELQMIEEKDKRLNFIISELNILSELKGSDEVINIYVSDPRWSQEEKPEKLITVEEEEVGVTPYISPSQVVVPPPELGPKDDFKERALINMMDGVLEKLWHEEIKKPLPKPECMLKENIAYTEDDLKEILKYEKAVEFRNEERDQYNKMLRAEYVKLSSSVNETITKFNQKIKDFHLLKVKVETSIGQEELKLMRLRTSNLDKIVRFDEIQRLDHDLELNGMELEYTQNILQDISTQTAECHTSYEQLMARDKAIDKNFKSSFSESSSVIADLCYKYFKKRPKWQQRAAMTAGVLYELAQACVTKERPKFSHPECIEFLKGLDQLDAISNMPAAINSETAWNNMCKLRRLKIELEIKIKAVLNETAEVETASGIWHKRAASLKITSQKLTNDLLQIRRDIEDGVMNTPLQEAGQQKLKAMRATTNFKKNILTMECEHAKLKMMVRHLEQDIYHLERVKVTKEIREFIQKKKKIELTLDNRIVERQIEMTRNSFNNLLKMYMRHVEELKIKIGYVTNQILSIDQNIASMKIKASDKHLSEDAAAQKKKVEACKKRMDTLVFRSKLISEVKKQYIAIMFLQTELELQRLRTYPTLSSFKTH